jgi:hypothetical protein
MFTVNAEIVGPWVYERTGGTWIPQRGTAIGLIDINGKLKAGVIYEDYNGANIVCHIAIDGVMSKKYLAMIFDYPFNQLNVKRITVPIEATNLSSINLVTKMGFILESRLEQATLDSDLLIFRMFKNECRFLSERYSKSLQG